MRLFENRGLQPAAPPDARPAAVGGVARLRWVRRGRACSRGLAGRPAFAEAGGEPAAEQAAQQARRRCTQNRFTTPPLEHSHAEKKRELINEETQSGGGSTSGAVVVPGARPAMSPGHSSKAMR
jgi:hypothetical protein